MNEAKITEYLGNIFHLETCIGENGNYEISSNYWDLKFDVRIREFTIFIQDGLGAKCSIDSDEDENTIAREIVGFVGDVLKNASKTLVYDGTNNILSWPYNCNLAYVDYLKQAMDMGADENIYEYEARKAGINNSKKPIKSTYDNEIYRQAFGALLEDYAPSEDLPGGYRVLVDGNYETEFSAESREEAIQKFKDYFANKKKGINNSKKPIKSGKDIVKITCYGKVEELPREEALAKYREGVFACDGCEKERYESIVEGLEAGLTSVDDDWKWVRTVYSSRQSKKPIKSEFEEEPIWTEDDEERLRAQYADENGLDLNEDVIDEDDYNEWVHKGAAMYSSPTRNQSSLNKIFS